SYPPDTHIPLLHRARPGCETAPPTSRLPYPTLFRSDRDDVNIEVSTVRTQSPPVDAVLRAAEDADAIGVGSRGRSRRHPPRRARSEEHTSELQSRFDLVCRLLLEKKRERLIPPHSHT